MPPPGFWSRVRQARLVRVLLVYLAASWLVLQVTALVQDRLQLPPWVTPLAFILLLVGLVVVSATAWVQSHSLTKAGEGELPGAWEIDLKGLLASLTKARFPHLTWGRTLLGGVVAFSLLFGAAGIYLYLTERGVGVALVREASAAPGPGIAVLPFRVVGPDLELWREGVVDLLSTNLDGVGGLRAIDPRAVLSRWRSLIGDREEPADRESALQVAEGVGASYAVTGSAVALRTQVRLTAEVYDTRTGKLQGRTQVEGPADSVLALVDRLSVEVLRAGVVREFVPPQLARVTTTSLPALKAYLEGEAHFRAGRWDEAIAHYQRAVEYDSTFAMAYMRMGMAYGWAGASPEGLRVTRLAERYANRLSGRERLKVRAQQGWHAGLIRAIEVSREIATQYPDDVDTWFVLGDMIFHFGFVANLDPYSSLEAFHRALALDSTFTSAAIHPFAMSLAQGDSAGARRYLELCRAVDPASSFSVGFGIAYSLLYGDPAERDLTIAALDTAGARSLSWAAHGLTGVTVSDPLLAVARAAAAAQHPTWLRRGAHLFAHYALLRHGRVAEAQRELEAIQKLEPMARSPSRWIVFDYLTGYGDSARAAQAASILEKDSTPEARWLLGALALRWGRYAEANAQVAALRESGDRALSSGDSLEAEGAYGLAQGLEGLLFAARADTRHAAQSLAEAAPRMQRGWYGIQPSLTAYHRFALAQTLEDVGRPSQGLEVYRVLSRGGSWPLHFHFQVPATLAAAGIEERMGDREQAIAHYSHVIEMWEGADPQLQPQVEAARDALIRLTGERATH